MRNHAHICTHPYYNIIHTVYMLTPAWNLPLLIVYCALQWFLLVLTSNAASIVSFIWSMNVMSSDVSCAEIQWSILMVFAAFSTTALGSQQGLSLQTLTILTECAQHCGQMLGLRFTLVLTIFLFLLVTHEIWILDTPRSCRHIVWWSMSIW